MLRLYGCLLLAITFTSCAVVNRGDFLKQKYTCFDRVRNDHIFNGSEQQSLSSVPTRELTLEPERIDVSVDTLHVDTILSLPETVLENPIEQKIATSEVHPSDTSRPEKPNLRERISNLSDKEVKHRAVFWALVMLGAFLLIAGFSGLIVLLGPYVVPAIVESIMLFGLAASALFGLLSLAMSMFYTVKLMQRNSDAESLKKRVRLFRILTLALLASALIVFFVYPPLGALLFALHLIILALAIVAARKYRKMTDQSDAETERTELRARRIGRVLVVFDGLVLLFVAYVGVLLLVQFG